MVITDQDIREFRERAKIELKSGHDCGRMRWDDIVEALCKEVERIRHESSGSLGNTTAMREALEYAARILAKWRQDAPFSAWDEYGEAIDKCHAALAKPPRQCDVGNAEEQSKRLREFCKNHRDGIRRCSKCPVERIFPKDCTLAWAQMPYEENESEVK